MFAPAYHRYQKQQLVPYLGKVAKVILVAGQFCLVELDGQKERLLVRSTTNLAAGNIVRLGCHFLAEQSEKMMPLNYCLVAILDE
jgi:hypothetical protein